MEPVEEDLASARKDENAGAPTGKGSRVEVTVAVVGVVATVVWRAVGRVAAIMGEGAVMAEEGARTTDGRPDCQETLSAAPRRRRQGSCM